jgi:cytochrome c oxidase subunit II
MLAGAAVLFALVMVLFVQVIRRPGWGSSVSPARWIVLGGLVLPAIVLLPLIAYALVAGERLLPLPGSVPPRIEAEGKQWAWTFRYPDHGKVTTKNVLHLPAGTPVDMVVTSVDVIHAFWIPRLAGKIDAVPGRVNRLRIQADQPGRFEALCNEFCGIGHAGMRFTVIVHRPEEFAAALAQAAALEKVEKK